MIEIIEREERATKNEADIKSEKLYGMWQCWAYVLWYPKFPKSLKGNRSATKANQKVSKLT